MDMEKKIEYLKMNASKRINYRMERGISIKDLYKELDAGERIWVADIYNAIKEEKLYAKKTFLYKILRQNSDRNPENQQLLIKFIDAARNIYELMDRKAKIEWPTIDDLNEASGLNLSGRKKCLYYEKMIKEGKLKSYSK